jgi:hypothetical protein
MISMCIQICWRLDRYHSGISNDLSMPRDSSGRVQRWQDRSWLGYWRNLNSCSRKVYDIVEFPYLGMHAFKANTYIAIYSKPSKALLILYNLDVIYKVLHYNLNVKKFNICEGSVGRDSNINNQKKFSSPPKRYDKIRLFDEIESSYCLGSEWNFCCLSILMLSARNVIGETLGRKNV